MWKTERAKAIFHKIQKWPLLRTTAEIEVSEALCLKTQGGVWHQQDNWIRSPLICQLGIHSQSTCLCGSCGIQHHRPRDPGELLPTYELGVKQTDLGPGCGSWSGPWTGFRLSWTGSRSPAEHGSRQSPMDERAFPGVQESNREVTARCCSKKYPRSGELKKVRGAAWHYPHYPSSKVAQLSAKRALLSPWPFPRSESECLASRGCGKLLGANFSLN